ncbi:hypothetical protein C8F04DRAFT_1248231 [Mycena alexandri]|uniref:Uncharacterized protein n=1 Tax=Mycena alexandri TaxID=1745969 RepID=A0AAD6TKG1_9AGAR|nr:hypothetical protein C8F04DRAFT_1248231 [Mycena alexandri]
MPLLEIRRDFFAQLFRTLPKMKGKYFDAGLFFRDLISYRETTSLLAKFAFDVLEIFYATPMLIINPDFYRQPPPQIVALDVGHLPRYPRSAKLQPVDNDKALPDAPDLLTPLRKHQPSPMFNNKSRWSWSNEQGRVLTFQQPAEATDGRPRWIFTFPALVISLLAFIMATIFLLYLAALCRVRRPNAQWAIFVFEPTGSPLLGLTITTVTTHLISISVPFLVSVAGYCVAGKWLEEQSFPPASRPALPTPLQYAFMVKMLTTSNVTSVYGAGRYMKAARRNIRFPRSFQVALALTSLIIGLSYSLILVDIWLHGSAFVVEGSIPSSIQRPMQITSFGVAFNESVCAASSACLQDASGDYGPSWATQAGLVVAANSSDTFSVITLNNASDMAIVVSKSANPFVTFEAPSFGIKAQCSSLTPSCTSTVPQPIGCSAFPLTDNPRTTSASASATTSASANSSVSATNSAASSSSTSQLATKLVPVRATTSNPQTVLVQLQWSANGSMVSQNPSAVETNNSNILAWASCDLTFYNLTLQHKDGLYGIAGEPILANPDFSNIMQRGLLSQLGNIRLLSDLQTTMLAEQNISSAVGAMNQELGRVALALFTGTLQPAPLLQSNPQQQPALLGRYPLVPVILYLFILYAYSLTAAIIYIWAARLRSQLFRNPGHKTTCAVQLGQQRLTDPLTLVAALYPSYPDNPMTEDPRELFMEETAVRLAISTHDGPQPMFGVYQRTGTWTLEMG